MTQWTRFGSSDRALSGGQRNRTPRFHPALVFKTSCQPFSGDLQRRRAEQSKPILTDPSLSKRVRRACPVRSPFGTPGRSRTDGVRLRRAAPFLSGGVEPDEGVEPSTSSVPRKRSTAELSGHVGFRWPGVLHPDVEPSALPFGTRATFRASPRIRTEPLRPSEGQGVPHGRHVSTRGRGRTDNLLVRSEVLVHRAARVSLNKDAGYSALDGAHEGFRNLGLRLDGPALFL